LELGTLIYGIDDGTTEEQEGSSKTSNNPQADKVFGHAAKAKARTFGKVLHISEITIHHAESGICGIVQKDAYSYVC